VLDEKLPAAAADKRRGPGVSQGGQLGHQILEVRDEDVAQLALVSQFPGLAHGAFPADPASLAIAQIAVRQLGAIRQEQRRGLLRDNLGKAAVGHADLVAVFQRDTVTGDGRLFQGLAQRPTKIRGGHARDADLSLLEEVHDDLAKRRAVQGKPPQPRLQVEQGPRGKRQEIARNIRRLERFPGQIDGQGEADKPKARLVGGLDHLGLFKTRMDEIDPFRGLEGRQAFLEKALLLVGEPARHEPDVEMVLEGPHKRHLDLGRGRRAAKLPTQAGHPLLDRLHFLVLELFDGNTQAFEHGFHIEIGQQRPLEQKRTVAVGAAGAADLAATDLDVVAGTKRRRHPHPVECRDGRLAQFPEQRIRGHHHVEKGLVAQDFPANLGFVEKQSPTAGDAAVHLDAVGPTVGQPHFLLDGLVKADQHGPGAELKEPQGIGGFPPPLAFQQHFVQGHVLGCGHRPHIQESPCPHGMLPPENDRANGPRPVAPTGTGP